MGSGRSRRGFWKVALIIDGSLESPHTTISDKLSWIYCGLQQCLYAPRHSSSSRSHSIHLLANLHRHVRSVER